MKQRDPYDHLASVHGHGEFPFRTADWADFAMYQQWDESGGYRFQENAGTQVKDEAETGPPLHLSIADPSAVRRLPEGGVALVKPTLIASEGPARKITEAIQKSGAFTLEAWIKPANTSQTGPARIVTLSRDPGQRNVTLGQGSDAYEVRFRTSSTSPNGEPSLWSPGKDHPAQPIYASRSPTGDVAVVYFEQGGETRIDSSRLTPNRRAQWFNPRTGERQAALPVGPDTFRAPDHEDWVLLLQRATTTE